MTSETFYLGERAFVRTREGGRHFSHACASRRIVDWTIPDKVVLVRTLPMRKTMKLPLRSALVALPLLAFACGGSTTASPTNPGPGPDEDAGTTPPPPRPKPVDAGSDADFGSPSDTYPAFKVSVPQVTNYGGNTMPTPKIVPIIYQGDTYTQQIKDLTTKIGTSKYWKDTTFEYGVGAITAVDPIILTDTAPTNISDDDVQTWLKSMLDGTHAEFGQPDVNAIYTIYYPATTTISLGRGGGTSCQEFGGYHGETRVGTTKVSYAVLPRCSGFGQSDLESLSIASSHEWIEAATDPLPNTDPAFMLPDDDHLAYLLFPLSEVGDMCAYSGNDHSLLEAGGLLVQRSWSNAAAKAYHDPCVPAPVEPYFNATPDLKETVDIDLGGGSPYPTKGVKVPVGQSKTIDLLLWSDAKTSGPFTVRAYDLARYMRQPQELSLSLDRDSGVNGEKLHLTISRTRTGDYGGSVLLIMNNLGNRRTMWTAWVAN